VEDQAVVLHLLTKRRQDLVAMRTQTINRLHRLLVDLVPGGARRNLTAKRAAALLAAVTPAGAPAVTRHQLAAELIADARQLEQRIAAVEARIKAAVAQANTSLLKLFGVGPVLAATFLGAVGDIGRFPQQAPVRRSYRDGSAGGLQRPGHPPPAVAGRGPQAQSRPVHDGHGPGPPAQRRAGLLPAQVGRGQVRQGSAAVSEAAALGRRLPVPAGRSERPAVPGGGHGRLTAAPPGWSDLDTALVDVRAL
jgi:hypothetical protein